MSFHLSGKCAWIKEICTSLGKKREFFRKIQLNLLWTAIHTEIANNVFQLGKLLRYGHENF